MSFDQFETRMREHRKRTRFVIVMANIVVAALFVLIIGLLVALIFVVYYFLRSAGAL